MKEVYNKIFEQLNQGYAAAMLTYLQKGPGKLQKKVLDFKDGRGDMPDKTFLSKGKAYCIGWGAYRFAAC